MTNATVKVTKREMFNEVIAMATAQGREDIVEFATHELELLAKKASKSTQTKAQKENEGLKENVYEALAAMGKPSTASEILAATPSLEMSNQKISALLKMLVDSGRVFRTPKEQKKAYFSIAPISADAE